MIDQSMPGMKLISSIHQQAGVVYREARVSYLDLEVQDYGLHIQCNLDYPDTVVHGPHAATRDK